MLPALLAVACYLLAVLQRPGLAVTDTKIDLHVDPVRFLADAAAPWSADISLGHVQSGQYAGYEFPMGPFFALGRVLGLAPWLVERLWLGSLYALAAWGVVRLLDALWRRDRGVAHAVAAAAYVLNPYVVTYTGRVSISLLAYALAPWLLLFAHRGLRDERAWVWPACFALAVASSGAGVNAAVTAWLLVGPALLVVYEPSFGLVDWLRVWRFVWRTALLGALTSLWWVVPLAVQARWGLPFLPYTEQPGTIWQTTSATESLRLMGFWLSYAGVGYGGRLTPYSGSAGTLLFAWPVVVASLLAPALALGGFAWTRRWRYGPFFLGLTLLGVLAMMAGFPEGTPLRSGLTFAYNHFAPLQFLRTTYKAGPLAALGLAVLGGVAAQRLWTARPAGRPAWVLGIAALLALSAWPLVRGRGPDDQLTFDHVPAAWTAAARDVDRSLGPDRRAMVLPGQLFSAYEWGETVDPILPTLARRPVAVRQVVPFADLRSVDLQWSTDALVAQRRALPGQLRPLLSLQGVGEVVTGADDDRARSGALGANAAARELTRAGLGTPSAAYGPVRAVAAQAGQLAAPVALPEVRRYSTPGEPMVRLLPRDGAVVVDGSAGGVLGLAALGALPAQQPLRYAADLDAARLRALAAAGSRIVVSDSNRRAVFVPSRLRGNRGATLAPGDPISADGHQLDPWPERGTDAQTVARLDGVRFVRAPFSPQVTQFPEHRPYAALDGDSRTAWLADRTLTADRWHLDVGLLRSRDVDHVDLLPYGDARGRVRAVGVNGRRFAVHAGWNRLSVRLHGVDELTVTMLDVTDPPGGAPGGAGGIRELRIPGVRVREALRPPVLAERALRGAPLARAPLIYLLERDRGDDPYHRGTVHGPWQAGEVRDQGDAEAGIERVLDPPAARTWSAQGWASVAPAAPDPLLDLLTGARGGRFASSSRFEGLPGRRASGAFDGDPRTAWIGGWVGRPAPGRAGASVSWASSRITTVRSLRLVAPSEVVRRPTLVRLVARGGTGTSPPLRVGRGGLVVLPAPLRARAFTLEVLDAAFPAGTTGVERQTRAVGIAELRGTGVARAHVRRAGLLRAGCVLRVAAGRAVLHARPTGTVADLDAGRPLRARRCGAPVALPAGPVLLRAEPAGGFRLDLLALDSAAPRPTAAPPVPGRVLSPGDPGRGVRKGIRLDVRAPAWLVLGESWSAGWRATCDGRSLGAPVPLQGYSAAWPVAPGCRTVDVHFAGNRAVAAGYGVSLAAAIALLVLLAVAYARGRARRREPDPADDPPLADHLPVGASLRRALAIGAAAALVGGFVFALRAGVVIGPLVAFVAWRGVGARRLALVAGGLLAVVVPVLYLAVPAEDKGGYGTNVPLERIAAHWVGVAAIVLLGLALYRALATAGVRARSPRTNTPSAAAH